MQAWARKRVQEAGLPVPSSIHMISSTKQLGVKDLLSELQQSAGMAGDVWVVSPPNNASALPKFPFGLVLKEAPDLIESNRFLEYLEIKTMAVADTTLKDLISF